MFLEKCNTYNDKNIKAILIGNAGVGKTNLINITIGKEFNENQASTLGQTFSKKKIEIDGNVYNIDLWDTIGQESLKSINKLFYKNSRIVIFVYDITNLKSFEDLESWISEVDTQIGLKNCIKGIVANKIDLFLKEEVSDEKGEQYAKSIGAKFLQISAKTSDPKEFINFITDMLKDYLASDIKKDYGNGRITIDYSHTIKKIDNSKCCLSQK